MRRDWEPEAACLFLDFYGTIVCEDDRVVAAICTRIAEYANASASEIGAHWWKLFSDGCHKAHGGLFQTQRTIESASIALLLEHYNVHISPQELDDTLFAYWQRPPLFDDAREFLDALPRSVSVCVVSNIDRSDLETAIAFHELPLPNVVTSEDARSYKPRSAIFELALAKMNVSPDEVLHVGDSMSSDVVGAQSAGIRTAWLNRKNRRVSPHVTPDYVAADLRQLATILGFQTTE